jgi:hypothetical protein
VTAKGTPCRNRAVDERGYCRMHLERLESAADAPHGMNGAGDRTAFGERAIHAIRAAGRRRTPSPPEDEG